MTSKKRMNAFKKGLKQGVAKQSVDNTLSLVTAKVAEVLNDKLSAAGFSLILDEKILDEFMKCVIMLGIAEMADLAGDHVDEKNRLKIDMISNFMREYSGEKCGRELVDILFKIIPVVFGVFAGYSAEELSEAADDMIEQNKDSFSKVEDLLLEDDEDEEEVEEETHPELIELLSD